MKDIQTENQKVIQKNAFYFLPQRIKFYVYDWIDNNNESYLRFYGDTKIHQLNNVQIKELLRLIYIHETLLINKSIENEAKQTEN